ncbi:MAG: TetR/AcrR family transcriptional regulator, partial [Christensenellales bacterium]
MAFTDYETEQLRKALLKETRRCAVTLGMKKTSVDQLTKAVGIAKGSFYKFYESKEMLFFAVLEGIHSELYNVADRA